MKKKLAMLACFVLLARQAVIPNDVKADVQKHQELYSVIKEANQKNMELDAPKGSTKQFRYNYKNNKPKVTEKDNALMWNDYDRKNIKKKLSVVQAKKEVRWLFRLLRSQYGLYTYYGGDAKFEKAKKEVFKDIGKQGLVTTKRYQKILHKRLGFITDEHLAIGEELFGASVRLFSDDSVHYIKRDGQYFMEDDPQDVVLKINGKKPDIYLKRAIDEDGYLTYYPYAMLKQKKGACSYKIRFQSGRTENIMLKPAEYSYCQTLERLYGYDKYDGAAYVEINQAYMEGEFPKERRQFLKDTADMRKQERLIIDLRNNTGGDGTLVDEWFLRYTGQKLLPNYSTLRIRPIWISSTKEIREMDEFAAENGLKRSGRYYYCQYPGHQYLDNGDKQIFVLTSRRTCSAAEAMTDALKNIENTVVIGTNTGGVLMNMANYSMAMPYSGLLLQFGESMQYFEGSYFQESYGIEPDVYLTGKNLDERLEKFFKLYVGAN